jgi:SAM-dependent methyltransferase
VLTVDIDRLGLTPGDTALDLGCGQGRHAFELYRRGCRVTAVDLNADDVREVGGMFAAMAEVGEAGEGGEAVALRADARKLPFGDGTFDAVVVSEVLEHIPDDRAVIAEATRVLKKDGVLAVTVPRWWPELVCWALSSAYHEVEGGHIRIYRGTELLSRLREAGLRPLGDTHHAHALHSPYWWLKCFFGPDNEQAVLPKLYHRLLVHDLMHRPWWTRVPEQLLNPVLGKSFVVYLGKDG